MDHADGLNDPAAHLWRLQERVFAELNADRLANELSSTLPRDDVVAGLGEFFQAERREDPRSAILRPAYVVVEKITSADESLPDGWPAHGTTGYDYVNLANGLMIDRRNQAAMSNLYRRFTERSVSYPDLSNTCRKQIMLSALPGEIHSLAYDLKRVGSADREHRDFTFNGLALALTELIAALPVYRTYVNPATGEVSVHDRAVLAAATGEAKRRNASTDPSIFDFVRDTLVLEGLDRAAPETAEWWRRFVSRFQQTTGAVMAKGAEDTAFYIYNRLTSLNEVGGDPNRFGTSLTAFHKANANRYARWPHSMLSTSTHDTKRSEDVRARIDVLSELPGEWQRALTRWSRLNFRLKTMVDGRLAPDRNEEYLLYQTLLGAWPLGEPTIDAMNSFRERIAGFMNKAVKEAKEHSSWVNPNEAYESAVHHFVMSALDPSTDSPFLKDFESLRRKVAHFGLLNSLSQTLLKVAGPGVADVYQGNELWDFSLVDPDNRRPVDFDRRIEALKALEKALEHGPSPKLAASLLASWEDGRPKLHVTQAGLALRTALSWLIYQWDV